VVAIAGLGNRRTTQNRGRRQEQGGGGKIEEKFACRVSTATVRPLALKRRGTFAAIPVSNWHVYWKGVIRREGLPPREIPDDAARRPHHRQLGAVSGRNPEDTSKPARSIRPLPPLLFGGAFALRTTLFPSLTSFASRTIPSARPARSNG
jgi:hypothetical protein